MTIGGPSSGDSGSHNVAIGYNAMVGTTTGSYNIAIGYNAMYRESVRCPACECEYFNDVPHPDNGCDLGVIYNVMTD